jgi:hypothetical protein
MGLEPERPRPQAWVGPVRPQESHDLARWDAEGQLVQGLHAAKPTAQAFQFEQTAHGSHCQECGLEGLNRGGKELSARIQAVAQSSRRSAPGSLSGPAGVRSGGGEGSTNPAGAESAEGGVAAGSLWRWWCVVTRHASRPTA